MISPSDHSRASFVCPIQISVTSLFLAGGCSHVYSAHHDIQSTEIAKAGLVQAHFFPNLARRLHNHPLPLMPVLPIRFLNIRGWWKLKFAMGPFCPIPMLHLCIHPPIPESTRPILSTQHQMCQEI